MIKRGMRRLFNGKFITVPKAVGLDFTLYKV
jgi:hypothetical protein